MRSAMQGNGARINAAEVPLPAAAIKLRIRIQQLMPETAAGDTDAIVRPGDGTEIARNHNGISRSIFAKKAQDVIFAVVSINPLKARGRIFAIVQRRVAAVEMIQIADEQPQFIMTREL